MEVEEKTQIMRGKKEDLIVWVPKCFLTSLQDPFPLSDPLPGQLSTANQRNGFSYEAVGSPVWSREHVLGTMAKQMEEMLRERARHR